MEKLAVSVFIPALGNTFDFIVPECMSVRNAQSLIIRILNSEYGISDIQSDVMLFDSADFSALRMECSFKQLGISDGSKLLMV